MDISDTDRINAELIDESVPIEERWQTFKQVFKKKYPDPAEDAERRSVFNHNVEQINKHNRAFENGEVSFSQGVNQFADLRATEFKAYVRKHGGKNDRQVDEPSS
uniref:Cathepsin propeptide inhibitor domain-containing protein n=1 Tax=Spongospora subterranea TaxID=70186 RepID=A0A0H5R4E7_9EUKA|eukprot:CRZ09013.1 hypothetical protein [Spongospora subterranea]